MIKNKKPENGEKSDFLSPALLEQIYSAYFPRIYNYLSYRTATREEAEDLTSQVFERVIASYNSFDPRRGSFESWIFTIARNGLLNSRRSQARKPQSELFEEIEEKFDLKPDELFLKQEELKRLRSYLSQLKERDRELVALRYAAGLSQRQIGEMLALNEPAVAVALGRATRRLREMFEKEDKPGLPEAKEIAGGRPKVSLKTGGKGAK